MAKTPVHIGLRLTPDEARQLRRVAKANVRSAAAEARVAVLAHIAAMQQAGRAA